MHREEEQNARGNPEGEVAHGEAASESVEQKSTEEETDWKKMYEEEREKYVRLLADFDNYKKRQEREKEFVSKLAVISVLREILRIYDDMERIVTHIKKEEGSVKVDAQAVLLAFSNFRETLKKLGVTEINISSPYPDPDTCDVVASVEIGDKERDGQIVQIVEKGYIMGEHVIRHAKVIIGRYSPQKETEERTDGRP